jgi:uncharacterized protein (TIGR00725 family)
VALHIGVVGEGVCSARTAAQAERVGRALARAGVVLICGGLGGVMEAASRGAAEAGGVVVGLLPGFQRHEANRWVTIPIVTGMDQARNVILVRSCDAIVAVGGMYGTLSEIALALKFGTPVVGLGTWRVRQPDDRRVPILVAATADGAVARALRAARRRRPATRRGQRATARGQRAGGRGQRAGGRDRRATGRSQLARRGGRAARTWLA